MGSKERGIFYVLVKDFTGESTQYIFFSILKIHLRSTNLNEVKRGNKKQCFGLNNVFGHDQNRKKWFVCLRVLLNPDYITKTKQFYTAK